MEEDDKLPLKRVELSLAKFNDVAIPHHLDLLRQHKANILRYEASGETACVRREQTAARRVAQQLRALLAELHALRGRVRQSDLPRFDAATQRSADRTLQAILDYLESPPLNINREGSEEPCAAAAGSAVSSDSVGVLRDSEGILHDSEGILRDSEPQLQLQVDDHEAALEARGRVLAGWRELQREVSALHDVWRALYGAAGAQRDSVAAAHRGVDTAHHNVAEGRTALSAAEKLSVGLWGVGGAAVGALAGGPVGLALGLKAGAAAALAGGGAGLAVARALAARRTKQLDADAQVAKRD